jgi:hypothetical protein
MKPIEFSNMEDSQHSLFGERKKIVIFSQSFQRYLRGMELRDPLLKICFLRMKKNG